MKGLKFMDDDVFMVSVLNEMNEHELETFCLALKLSANIYDEEEEDDICE
jgi:hypothetical protein